ncbi:MAG TPA: hypothetical protein VKF81_01935 [Blastocatellia bacterium]|nr:hypothetical protein [Blastocatellia bacterium]
MTIKRTILVTVICTLAVLASIAGVAAQSTHERKADHHEVILQQMPDHHDVGAGGFVHGFSTQGENTFMFVSSEMSFDGKTVKGAPYSAEAVSESVQTLADGNRIVRRSSASVYRDSEGRTRREQTINAVGVYSAAGDLPQLILINDPIAGVNYILDVKSHTARKALVRKFEVSGEGMAAKKKLIDEAKSGSGETGAANTEQRQKAEAELKAHIAKAETGAKLVGIPGGIGPGVSFESSVMTKIDPKNVKKESLGKQTIEGVEAEGTRFTTTIAAGEIGNEQPINIISERWYSEELQTVVMSKHSDPRLGENTYRLTNINRAEPAHSLFELPSDYTVKETIEPGMRLKIENEVRRPREKQQQ